MKFFNQLFKISTLSPHNDNWLMIAFNTHEDLVILTRDARIFIIDII